MASLRLAIPRRLVCCALALLADLPGVTIAQQTSPIPDASPSDQGGGSVDDVLNASNLLQLFYSIKTAPGTGPNGTTQTVTTDTFKLRGDAGIQLRPDWQLALRADLPYLAKDPTNSSNPAGEFLYGLGDADVQAALIHAFNKRWIVGFGARLIMPTGDPSLGSGKWQIMPIAGVRYALPEISPGSYFEPIARYDASFAGDPAKKAISNLQFAPMLNIALPDRWFVAFYPTPDIRWNFGPPITGQTGRLFLPIDVRAGRKITNNVTLSLEVGVPIVKQYPVYDFITEAETQPLLLIAPTNGHIGSI